MSDGIVAEGASGGGGLGSRHLFIGGLGIGQICSWGSLYYSFPQIAEAMRADLGFTKPELYGAASLGLALAGLASYPVGAAIDRGHGRTIMAGGSILAGLLLLAWSQVSDLILFYPIFAGVGLLQAATLYPPAFAVVARRFGPGNARPGITALTLWGGFASTVFVPLIESLLDLYGWRGALMMLGGVNLVLCAGLYGAVIDPRADAQTETLRGPAAPGAGASAVWTMLRLPTFWALAVAFTAFAGAFSAFTFHLYPMLLERGFDALTVVSAIAVIGPAQVAGRIIIWAFAPRASVRRIGAIIVTFFPLAIVAFGLIPESLALLAVVAAVYGGANGIMTIVQGMAVPEMLTRHAYGAINGVLTAPALVAKAVAPALAALLWSASASYDAVLLAIVAGAALMCASFWTAAAFSRSAS